MEQITEDLTLDKANTFGKDKGTIYDEKSRVADSGAAFVMAQLEAPAHNKGASLMDKEQAESAVDNYAAAAEASVRKLTPQEEENIAFMRSVEEKKGEDGKLKYDKALVAITDSKGREYRVLHFKPAGTASAEGNTRNEGQVIFFSKDGLCILNAPVRMGDDIFAELDWNRLGDEAERMSVRETKSVMAMLNSPGSPEHGYKFVHGMSLDKMDITSVAQELRLALEDSQKMGEEMEARKLEKAGGLDKALGML